MNQRHFAIKKRNLLNLPEVYVANVGYILPYTADPSHIRHFGSRAEADEEIRNEFEVIVDLRHQDEEYRSTTESLD